MGSMVVVCCHWPPERQCSSPSVMITGARDSDGIDSSTSSHFIPWVLQVASKLAGVVSDGVLQERLGRDLPLEETLEWK